MTVLVVVATLFALMVPCLIIEHRRPERMTLELSFKGDIKRESAFLAQYGQSVATPIAGWIAAIAYGNDWRVFAFVCGPVLAVSAFCSLLKRCFGRMRPNREMAGRFTGFSWRRKNSRESFPSSHSACAFACTVTLVHLWPAGAPVFWTLATITALLRFVLSAHFPADILAGIALGIGLTEAIVHAVQPALLPHH